MAYLGKGIRLPLTHVPGHRGRNLGMGVAPASALKQAGKASFSAFKAHARAGRSIGSTLARGRIALALQK